MSGTDPADTPRQAIARAEAAAKAGRYEQALAEYASAIDLAGSRPEAAPASADAWLGSAIARLRLGGWREAHADAGESRRVAASIRDERRLALAENLLGAIAFESGNWHEAALRYGVAREHAGTIEDEPLLLEIENNDGVLWAAAGDRKQAEESFRRALARFDELERHPCGARVLNNLGLILTEDGRLDEADALYDRALLECKRRSDLELGATVMVNRARLALAKNDVIRAHALAATAEAFCERMEKGPLGADVACLMGAVARTLCNWADAEANLRRALEESADGRAPLAEAEAWAELGELYSAQDLPERTAEAWRQAAQRYRALGAHGDAERIVTKAESLGALFHEANA